MDKGTGPLVPDGEGVCRGWRVGVCWGGGGAQRQHIVCRIRQELPPSLPLFLHPPPPPNHPNRFGGQGECQRWQSRGNVARWPRGPKVPPWPLAAVLPGGRAHTGPGCLSRPRCERGHPGRRLDAVPIADTLANTIDK